MRGRVPHPALLALLDRLVGSPQRVLVPRGGPGPDATAWAAAGHEVVSVDRGAELSACRVRSRHARVRLVALEMDVLTPPRDFEAAFDVVWERSCFCGLDAREREAYVRAMARVLRPGGRLHGLFLDAHDETRPRETVTEACIRSHFQGCFEVVSLERLGPGFGPSPGLVAELRRRAWRPCRVRR